jgi:PhnB protein
MTSRKGIPENSSVVMPRLVCRDPESALNFYVDVFGASVLNRRPGADGRLAHALITIGPAMVMIETEWPTLPSRAPALDASSPVVIFVYVEDVDAAIARAVANGATVLMEAQNQFWGDRIGWIMDPAGHVWTIASRIEETTEAQRSDRWSAILKDDST